MHEEILKKYFVGEILPIQLNDDLVGTSVKRGPKEISQEIIDMQEEFVVKPQHIIKLLYDVLDGKIDPGYLEAISFALLGSDHFTWDYNDAHSDIMSGLFQEWASPEINYELNFENIKDCLQRLENFKPDPNYNSKPKVQLLFNAPPKNTNFVYFQCLGHVNQLNRYLYVEFNPTKSKGWVGCFERGMQGFDGIRLHPNKRYQVIIAGGEGYIVDPVESKLIQNLGKNYSGYFQK